jgi:uncharacterized protein YggE
VVDLCEVGPARRLDLQQRLRAQHSVTRRIAVILHDLSKFESLLSGVLQAGVNYVHNIEFRNTELRKHRARARSMAILAAREKAVALAKDLGQKVGRPHGNSDI